VRSSTVLRWPMNVEPWRWPVARVLSTLVITLVMVTLGAVASPAAGASPDGVTRHGPDPNALVAAGEVEVITKVFEADRPDLAYQRLSVPERVEFDRWMMPARLVEVDSVVSPAAVSGAIAPYVSCWSSYRTYRGKSLFGLELFEMWLQGGWCTEDAVGGAISATYYGSGGSGLTSGWQHDGRQAYWSGLSYLYGKGIIWAQHKFSLRAAGIPLQTVYKCLRIIGGPFSTTNTDYVCSP
jgi:hypothetical protein